MRMWPAGWMRRNGLLGWFVVDHFPLIFHRIFVMGWDSPKQANGWSWRIFYTFCWIWEGLVLTGSILALTIWLYQGLLSSGWHCSKIFVNSLSGPTRRSCLRRKRLGGHQLFQMAFVGHSAQRWHAVAVEPVGSSMSALFQRDSSDSSVNLGTLIQIIHPWYIHDTMWYTSGLRKFPLDKSDTCYSVFYDHTCMVETTANGALEGH